MTTSEIAREEGIPGKFLEAILLDLRKAGLLRSQRGPEGGHRLARPTGEITVGDIWRAMDGSLSPAAGQAAAHSRNRVAASLKPVWAEVEQAVAGVVDGITLAELCRRVDEAGKAADYTI